MTVIALVLLIGMAAPPAGTPDQALSADGDAAGPADNGIAITEQDHHEHHPVEEILVTARPGGRTLGETVEATSVLAGEGLDEALSPTIGDTLAGLPGVSQTAFGQAASRPVIRGLSGDRLRVLVNGLGSFDVSTASPDHAVALDLSSARRIEVVRGPATLLYGADAVAGVVNVIDDRVPRDLPADGRADGFLRALYGANSNQVQGGGSISAEIAGGLMAHAGGYWLDTGDFHAPGFLRSAALRASEALTPGTPEPFGRADNSDQRNWSAGGGVSYVGDFGFFGSSVTSWKNNYGVPVESDVRIDANQTRVDVIGEVDREVAFFDQANLRFGYGDYGQVELEDGAVGTRFANKEWEARMDLIQRPIGDLTGTIGLQFRGRDFSAEGDEVFAPASQTFGWGLVALESYDLDRWRIDTALRLDRQRIDAGAIVVERDGMPVTFGDEVRHFTGVSLSAGLSYTHPEGYLFGVTGFRVERQPTAAELFSGGPELATQTFVLGNADLGEETLRGIELTLKKTAGPLHFSVNGFYYSYRDFITQRFTGRLVDGLREVVFDGIGTRFLGIEIEGDYEAWQHGDQALILDLSFDLVNAEERASGRPLPRIPPKSLTLAAEYQSLYADFRIEGAFSANQTRLAAFETAPGSSLDLSATLTLHPFPDQDIALLIQGRNLAGDTIRYHASFLQDRVPAPGRDLRIALKAEF
ncbi:MAG: TonB-dependent receptor [Alphaproteobacteria bacterium]|nr:MAG: TonB-dependent receptor [Alphaproteobacteria bacterium]